MFQKYFMYVLLLVITVQGCASTDKNTSYSNDESTNTAIVEQNPSQNHSASVVPKFIEKKITNDEIRVTNLGFKTMSMKEYSLETHKLFVAKLSDELLFELNESNLQTINKEDISKFSQLYKSGKLGEYIYIVGHTDSRGTRAYNQSLSARRAWFIASLLVKNGVNPSLVKLVPAGESQPVESNSSERGRNKNRRVEIMTANSRELLLSYFRQIKCPDNSCDKSILPVMDIYKKDGNVFIKYNQKNNIATLSPELNNLKKLVEEPDTKVIDQLQTRIFHNDYERLNNLEGEQRKSLMIPATVRTNLSIKQDIRKPLLLPKKYLYSTKVSGV